jgi:V8-like Glu-specific endopeptidase
MSLPGIIETPVEVDRLVERVDYAVIGPSDGRRRVLGSRPPYRGICHLERSFGAAGARPSGCTGFLVAPGLVVTAGHCVFSPLRRSGPRRIQVVPGRDGPRAPFGASWGARWYAHPAFVARFDPRYDYGVVVLARRFETPRPDFRLTVLTAAQLEDVRAARLVRVAGYPADKGRGEMWAHAERLDKFGQHLVHYSIDTCPGHSGAPVWLDAGDGRAQVIAIHTRGPRPSARGPWGCRPGAPLAPPGHFNAGVRMTDEVRDAIRRAASGGGPLVQVGGD